MIGVNEMRFEYLKVNKMKINTVSVAILLCTTLALPSFAQEQYGQGLIETPPSEVDLQSANEVPQEALTQTRQETEIDPNLFFDSQSLVPSSQLSVIESPKRVNPKLQPGSSLIVVDQNASSNSVRARLVAADRAIDLGRYQAALEIYNELHNDYPKNKEVLLGRAITLQNMGHEDHAIAAYEELLDLDEKNLDAHINMLGIVAKKYPAVALQRLQTLKDDNGTNAGLVSQIAFVQASMKLYDDALNNYAFLAAQEPRNAQHLLNMAIVADKAGMDKAALKYYQQALDVDSVYGGGRSVNRDQIFDRIISLR